MEKIYKMGFYFNNFLSAFCCSLPFDIEDNVPAIGSFFTDTCRVRPWRVEKLQYSNTIKEAVIRALKKINGDRRKIFYCTLSSKQSNEKKFLRAVFSMKRLRWWKGNEGTITLYKLTKKKVK